MRLPFDHFDLIARWYDRVLPRTGDDPLVPLLAAEPGHTILDVGGGTGRVSKRLQEDGAKVIICDLSWQMARRAQSKGLPVVLASADALPFAAGSLDRLLVVDAFHHFIRSSAERTQVQAVFEMMRVLGTNGRLVLEEPDVRRFPVKLMALAEKAALMGSRFLPPADILAIFRAAGAREATHVDDGFSMQLLVRK